MLRSMESQRVGHDCATEQQLLVSPTLLDRSEKHPDKTS